MTDGSRSPGPRASLLVILPTTEFRVALDRRVTSVGADPGCALSLEGQDLAAHHCIIQRGEAGAYELFDLSGGRLTLNGGPVQAAQLRCGDQIGIGAVRLAFLTELEPVAGAREAILAARAAAPAEEPGVLALAEDSWESARRIARPAAPPASETPASEAAPARAPWRLPPLGRWLRTALGAPWRRARAHLAELRRDTAVIPRPPLAQSGYSSLQAAVDALVPHPAAQRSQTSFGEAALEGLRRTPYLVLSLAVHSVLLLILSIINQPLPVDFSAPPHHAALDFDGDDLEFSEVNTAAENPEIEVERPDEIHYPEPSEDNELLAREGETGETGGEGVDDHPVQRDLFSGSGGLSGLGSAGRSAALAVGDDSFGKSIRKLRASGLDIVFVVDSTGSMNEILEETRVQVEGMVAHLASLVPGFRLGLVTYRDDGDLYVTRHEPLTPYTYQIVDFLDTIRAGGGGDHPEAVFEALRTAAERMQWSPKAQRIIVLIGDAPPHPGELKATLRLAERFAGRGGTIHTIYTDTGNHATDADRASFEEIARCSGGTHVPLAQRHRIVQRIVEVALGQQHSSSIGASLREGEEGWRGRAHRRLVKTADARRILRELRREPVRETFLRELVRHNRETFLPAYLEVLGDPAASRQARWAACVLTKRLIAKAEPPASLLEAVDALSPDLGNRRLGIAIARFRERAQESGFLVDF